MNATITRKSGATSARQVTRRKRLTGCCNFVSLAHGALIVYRKYTMKQPKARSRFGECAPSDNAKKLDARRIEGPAADEELAILAKAIGHPLRVQILRILNRRTTCVCGDIVDELPVAQSTVSQHLKVLKEAGLIRGEIDGPRVCYCLEPSVLRRFKALVGGL